ncbi:MAG: S8 family serine peptidase [Candidatus Eiseniibacteriota bacterium]
MSGATSSGRGSHRFRSSPGFLLRLLATGLVTATVIAIFLLAGCGEQPAGSAPTDRGPLGIVQLPLDLPDEPRPVPGQVVVELAVGDVPDDLNVRLGMSTLLGLPQIGKWLLATPEQASVEETITLLELEPAVLDVHRNWRLQSPEAEQASLAFNDGSGGAGHVVDRQFLRRLRAPEAHLISTGEGITIAVVDTGVDLDHPELVDRIATGGYDFIDDDAVPDDVQDGLDQDGDGLVDEAAGHGTHVAGLALLVAPDARVLPVRVLDSEGWGDVFTVAAAVLHASEHGAEVINMSVGIDGQAPEIADAVAVAIARGCFIVSSAGNAGRNAPYHNPAGLNEVYAVTASDTADHLAEFSNFGPHIDLCAPGVGLESTYVGGGHAVWSGTSMAAPLVSGGAALIRAIDGLAEGWEIAAALELGAGEVVLDRPGLAHLTGAGRLDLCGALVALD